MRKSILVLLFSLIPPLVMGCDGSNDHQQDTSSIFGAMNSNIAEGHTAEGGAMNSNAAELGAMNSKIAEQESIIAGLQQELRSNPVPPALVPPSAPLPPVPRFAKPSLGWNAWNTFMCSVNEDLIKSAADAIASNGMKDAGYEYVVMDDCWTQRLDSADPNIRDKNGVLVADPIRFPHGIKSIADYVHSKGLKFGIYSSPSRSTCAAFPGSLGHEQKDAQTFAEWGADYLKYDLCGGEQLSFVKMRAGLDKYSPDKPIYYAGNPMIRPSSTTDPYLDMMDSATFAFDIRANWDSIMSHLDQIAPFAGYSVPGYTNYADMLEVGVGSVLTEDQQRAHFGMWAMLAGPLTAGNDVRSQSKATLKILTNKDIIAINQDKLQLQAMLLADSTKQGSNITIWQRPLAESGVRAVLVLNRGSAAATVPVKFADFGLSGSVHVNSLWDNEDLGAKTDKIDVTVPPTGSVVLRLKGDEAKLAGKIDLTVQPWIYATETAKQKDCIGADKFYCWKDDPEQARSGLVPRIVVKDTQIVAVNSERVNSSSTATRIRIGKEVFDRGFVGSTFSQIVYRLNGQCTRFNGFAGVDNLSAGVGSVKMQVWDESKPLYSTFNLAKGDEATPFSIDVTGIQTLRIILRGSESGLLADIASPVLECKTGA